MHPSTGRLRVAAWDWPPSLPLVAYDWSPASGGRSMGIGQSLFEEQACCLFCVDGPGESVGLGVWAEEQDGWLDTPVFFLGPPGFFIESINI